MNECQISAVFRILWNTFIVLLHVRSRMRSHKQFQNQGKKSSGATKIFFTLLPPPIGIGDNFIVNNFMFCTDHGQEFCDPCFCDHRICNNLQMEFDEETIEKLKTVVISVER